MWIVSTIGYWVALVIFTILFSVIALFASYLDSNGDSAHQVARLWGKTILFFSGVKVKLSSEVKSLSFGRSYIFMANHQSAFDIFTLLAGLSIPFRWLAKEELFRIPIFGPSMRRAGYIPINRDSPRDAIGSLNKAAQIIRKGVSVVVFPEGTRSEDGKLLPFKNGGFVLAIKSKSPIVPTAIIGTFQVKPRGRFSVHPRTVYIHLGIPIETEGYTTRDKDELKEKVSHALSTLLSGNYSDSITRNNDYTGKEQMIL